MAVNISYAKTHSETISSIIVCAKLEDARRFLSAKEYSYVKAQVEKKKHCITVNRLDSIVGVVLEKEGAPEWRQLEELRLSGNAIQKLLVTESCEAVQVISEGTSKSALAVFEGMLLGNYSFDVYKTIKQENNAKLNEVVFVDCESLKSEIEEISAVSEGVFKARNWINEPVMTLTAPVFAEQIEKEAKSVGLSVNVYDKKWIEDQKMAGLLAVNLGSVDEPRFTVIEWNPEGAVNEKPLVLVGKGIVYDTGGISLKPSNFMDWMKADMGGASAIAGAMLAIAKNNLPVKVTAVLPSTDNRPSGNAYVPGDVIRMRNGKTVEVLNTDAEGRMILADGLDYAEELQPDLVVDVATLTGAAANAVGDFAVVAMGTAEEKVFQTLDKSGYAVCERVVRFPFWSEYGDMIKSEIADIKNIGGTTSGAITAGKFLEHFVKSPWVHIDISGSAFLKTKNGYRGIGGTGFGVRLLYDFIKQYYIK